QSEDQRNQRGGAHASDGRTRSPASCREVPREAGARRAHGSKSVDRNTTLFRSGNLKTSETNAAELARLMVGREVLLRVAKSPAKPGPDVLTVRNLSVQRVHGVSFDVRAGEIVGSAGGE